MGGKSTSTGKRKADNTRGRGNIGTSKKHASDAVQAWTGLEEQEEFATALLQDSQNELMARVNKTHGVEDPSADELDDGEIVESTGEGVVAGGSMPPPSYAELSFFWPSGAFRPVMWQ